MMTIEKVNAVREKFEGEGGGDWKFESPDSNRVVRDIK